MSDPRMIPASEARETLREVQGAKTNLPWWGAWVGDLAHTVVTQAAQIERVREVLAWAEQAETRAHADWIATADTHHRDAALAYTQAVAWLRYALGDADE